MSANLEAIRKAEVPKRLNTRVRVQEYFETLRSQDQDRRKMAKSAHEGIKRPAEITLCAVSPGLKVPRILGPILARRFKRLYSQTDMYRD